MAVRKVVGEGETGSRVLWLWRMDGRRPLFIETVIFRGKGRWTYFSRELAETSDFTEVASGCG